MPQPSTTRTILASAILLMLGAMACPNTPWDSADPARELERMHARAVSERAPSTTSPETLNVVVRQADGSPAPGVSIRISAPARSPQRERALFEGKSGEDGRCTATIRVPVSVRELAIEWSAPGVADALGRPGQAAKNQFAHTLVERSELATLELSLARP